MANSINTTLVTEEVAGLQVVTARKLVGTNLPPIQMVVGTNIPAGLLLLAGDPKAGKTLLAQDLSLSIAGGEPAWGGLEVPEGDVLYIANEGGMSSFRDRLVKMLDVDEVVLGKQGSKRQTALSEVPERMAIASTEKTLGGDLEPHLEAWVQQADCPRLIVIDTLTSVSPATSGANRHQEDYSILRGLADLASRYPGLLIVVVHHTRKAESEDVMHKITGSQGLAAATDGNAVLTRGKASNQCKLHVRPRNAEESELVLERGANLRWTVAGGGERALLSAQRQAVLDWLEANPEGHGPKEIAAALGMDYQACRKLLSDMADAGQIRRRSRGRYEPLTAGDAGEEQHEAA
jgi:hypothetical protein